MLGDCGAEKTAFGPRWLALSGLLEVADGQDMLSWEHGGFYLDAAVRIDGDDRARLERRSYRCVGSTMRDGVRRSGGGAGRRPR
jgi:hypothetical protein